MSRWPAGSWGPPMFDPKDLPEPSPGVKALLHPENMRKFHEEWDKKLELYEKLRQELFIGMGYEEPYLICSNGEFCDDKTRS